MSGRKTRALAATIAEMVDTMIKGSSFTSPWPDKQQTSTLSPEPVYWVGEVPAKCSLSGKIITKTFVDGRLPDRTTWAFIHPKYFAALGGKFGVGNGQLYEKQTDGRWLKVEG